MYMYVVVLNQDTPVVGMTLSWGPGWNGGGGKQVFSSLQGGIRKSLKQLGGRTDVFQYTLPISGAHLVLINDTSLTLKHIEIL